MAQPPKHQHRKRPWLVRFLRGHWRLWSCSVVGLVVFALLPAEGLPVPRFLFAWDASVILYIGLIIYWMIYHSAAGHIRQRSADQDEGQELALGLSISAVIVSLSLVVVWLSATPKGSHADLGLGLAALTSVVMGLHSNDLRAALRGRILFRAPQTWRRVAFSRRRQSELLGLRLFRLRHRHGSASRRRRRHRQEAPQDRHHPQHFNVTTIALTVSIVGDAASNNS